jgi:hypothetical protein
MDNTLTAYPPLPKGTPHLMPFEAEPFNGDAYLQIDVMELRDKHNLKMAVETGTCFGSTTMYLAKLFDEVVTVEISDQNWNIAGERFKAFDDRRKRIFMFKADSAKHMPWMMYGAKKRSQELGGGIFCFLDSHWLSRCPLLDELDAIAASGTKPVIVIHDFQVPGTDFGFDSMPDGRPFNLELVTPYLNRIYGEGNWKHTFPTKVEGANRGWVSIEAI